MTFSTSDELRRIYQSPIPTRPTYSNPYRDYNHNRYSYTRDNFRDWSKYDFPRDTSKDFGKFDNLRDNYRDWNRFDLYKDANLNYNSRDYRDLNYNRYSNLHDNFKDYSYSRYNRNHNLLSSDLNKYNYHKDDPLFESDNYFDMPNYLKSVDRYTPNKYSNLYTPNKYNSFSSPNLYNSYNYKYNSLFNKDSNRYNYLGNREDWDDNYLRISSSPNLRFNTQFYPNNRYSTFNSYRDSLRDPLLNTTYKDNLLSSFGHRDYRELKDNMNYAYNRDKLERIKSNLNTTFSSHHSNFDLPDPSLNPAPPDRDDFDRRSPLTFRHPRRAPPDLDALDIDDLYNKVRQQKQHLLSLKTGL